jgi:DNA polymerase III epsilon subunit-like protein
METPKIIIFDIETAPMLVASFGLYPDKLDHSWIVQDWFMICAAWKELGSKKVEAAWITRKGDDKKLVKTLRDALAEADIVVGHNIKNFDLKKLNARLIYHRLDPLPQIQVVDTLDASKRYAANVSNRLDYLSNHLLGQGKMQTSYGLWLRAMNADTEAVAEMVKYNKIDVIRNEEYYNVIRPYMRQHPHRGAMQGKSRFHSCPHCGSNNIVLSKTRYTAAGLIRYQKKCKDCHAYSTHTKE